VNKHNYHDSLHNNKTAVAKTTFAATKQPDSNISGSFTNIRRLHGRCFSCERHFGHRRITLAWAPLGGNANSGVIANAKKNSSSRACSYQNQRVKVAAEYMSSPLPFLFYFIFLLIYFNSIIYIISFINCLTLRE